MDAAGELAQLADRRVEVVRRGVEQLAGRLRVALQARARGPQRDRERDELLLRAVVQVALDPAPRGVRALHDPRARRAQLLHLRTQLGLQSLVLERERRGAADRAHALRSSATDGSCTSIATGLPSCSTGVHIRPEPSPGSGNETPAASTHSARSGSQYASCSERSPSASANASRSTPRRRPAPSRATSSLTATAPATRLRSSPARNANGTIASAITRARSRFSCRSVEASKTPSTAHTA